MNPTDLHPNQMNQPGSCSRRAAEVPQLVVVNNLIAANMLAAFYNLTDPEIYSQVLKNAKSYGEVYVDMIAIRTKTNERPV
jgi:hypothetical protein